MQTILKFWIFLVLSLVLSISFSQSWLSDWQYRIPITITERSGNTLTDYQVLVVINTQNLISQGKMRSDCGDIRFTDSDGITLLNYWIESGCNSANTRIWVKVPNIPANSNKTIYLYYGNPSATSMSNPKTVWLFFEDWENSRDPNWVDGGGFTSADWEYATPGFHGNYRLHFKTGRSNREWDNMWWKGSTFNNFRLIVLLRADYYDDDPAVLFRSTGRELGSDRVSEGYMFLLPRAGYQYFSLRAVTTSGIRELARYSAAPTTDIVRVEILAYGSSLRVNIERPVGTFLATLSANDNTFSSGYVGIAAPEWDARRNPSFDMFAVGKYASPEPTISLGNEEITIQITIHSPQNITYYSNVITINITTYYHNNYSIRVFLNNNEIFLANNLLDRNDIVFNYTLSEEGTYNLTVIANITDLNIVRTSSVIFTFRGITTIQIISPQNMTYYSNIVNTSIQVNSTIQHSVYIFLDNNLIFSQSYNASNNTINLQLNLSQEKTYNLTVLVNSSVITNHINRSSVIFTFRNFERVNINLYSDYNYLPNRTLENFYYFFEIEIVNANPHADFNLYFNYTNNYSVQKLANNKLLLKFYTENIDSNENIFVNRTALITLSAYLANVNKTFYYNFTYNFLVFNLNLYNCTNPNSLRILAFDEETLQSITLNYSYVRITYYSFNENYKTTKAFENALNICVYPEFTNYYYTTIENILLRRDNYALAEYYSNEKIILSNSTRDISLYLLSNQYAVPIKFRLPSEDYILVVERKYDSNFVFLRSTKSDFNKYALLYLRPYDIFYRIKVFDENFNLCFLSNEFRIVNNEYFIDRCTLNISFKETQKIDVFPEKNVIVKCALYNFTYICEFESLDKLDHNVSVE
ncbi:MAG: DUF2341 domain-containing protein, partial [Nanopusillaceae archaeon]